MAKRQGVLEDIVDIAAKWPWWVGVLLAVVSYGSLHLLAGAEIATPKNIHEMGAIFEKQAVRTFAYFGQYLLTGALLIGAAVSAYGRQKRKALHLRVSTSDDSNVLQDMSWQEFEMLVGEAFRRKGFSVRETGGAGPDGGVDLVLSAGSEKFLVQCKQWRAMKVSVSTVRDLYGAMAAAGASGGFVVSSGEFTKDAAEFARGRNIELVDRKQLMALVQDARPSVGAPRQSEQISDPWHNPAAMAEEVSRSLTPSCPLCGSAMTQRVAKRGANAGKPFWGCTTFPRCRGTLPSD